MKKMIGLVMIFAFLMSLSGCDMLFGSNEPQKLPLVAPINVKLFDDTLTWDNVTDATGYVVLINNQEQETVQTNTYTFTSMTSQDQEIAVKAYRENSDGSDDYSSSSVSVIRYKNTFSTDETVVYDFKDRISTNGTVSIQQEYEIPAAVRYVKIEGKPADTYLFISFFVKNRNTPLVIDLINFNSVGLNSKEAIYTDASITESWIVIINSLGQSNSLRAGSNYSKGSDGSNAGGIFGVGGNGAKGPAGLSALRLPNIILKGSADLTLTGGVGGRGGDGGNGWANFGGDGGDGGEGGTGAIFSNFYVKLGLTTTVRFVGGNGGEGGYGGNSTPLTTPKNGKTGSVGKKYVGTLTTVSGIVS